MLPVMRVKSVDEAVEHVNTNRLALQVCAAMPWPAFKKMPFFCSGTCRKHPVGRVKAAPP